MSRRGQNKTLQMLSHIKEVEREFDEPLRDIVIVMRWQGCNWKTIAGVLGMSYTGLLKWRKKFKFARPIPELKRYEEKRGPKSPVDSIAKKHGYKSFDDLYRDMRLSKKMTVEQVSKKIGVTSVTVRKWTPKELKGIRHITDAIRSSACRNLELAREHRNTPWSDDLNISRARDLHKGEL